MIKSSTEAALAQASKHCASRGVRFTAKRQTVLTGLLESGQALSAYELMDYCRDELDIELLPMSIYRILAFLEREMLIHRVNLTNKYIACAHLADDCVHEPGKNHASHLLICTRCHRVKEVEMPPQLLRSIVRSLQPTGFQLAKRHLEIDCLCSDCAESGNATT
ncbi:MAG: transcriptional repressor [Pseudomonadota bacterium]